MLILQLHQLGECGLNHSLGFDLILPLDKGRFERLQALLLIGAEQEAEVGA